VSIKRFVDGVESTLPLHSVHQTLYIWCWKHTCTVKCTTHTIYLVVGAHLQHEVCTDHFLYSGKCTPGCNWYAVFFSSWCAQYTK